MKRFSKMAAALLIGLSAWGHAADKESYVAKAESELKELNMRVEQLQQRVESAGSKTRQELNAQMAVLREKLTVAESKVTQIRHSSQSTWKGLRQAADQARKEVKDAYKSISTKLHRAGSAGGES